MELAVELDKMEDQEVELMEMLTVEQEIVLQ
jgi:hypothetical protein